MSNESDVRKNIARIPIIPIDYTNREKSTKGEIMVDWEDRKLYAKNPYTDNFTQIGYEPPEEDKKSTLDVSYFAGVRPLPHRYTYDESSIKCFNRIVQLVGYSDSNIEDIPYKGENGYLLWDNKYELTKSSMTRNKIIGIKVNNDMVILKDGNFYEMTNLEGKVDLKLPSNIKTSYAKIVMKLTTNDNIEYTISGTLEWDYNNDAIFKPNTTRLYTFETWNNGTSWYVSTKSFNYEENISIDYITDNYFNKTETNNLLSWSYIDSPDTKSVYKMRGIKTLQEYNDIDNKDNNTFYFIEDASQIFRGSNSFSKSYRSIDDFPTTNILDNIIYIKKSNLQMKIYDGTNWIEISKPILDIIDDDINNNDSLPTKSSIINYMNSKYISSIDDFNVNNKIVTPKALDEHTTSTITEDFDNIKNKLTTAEAVKTYTESVFPTTGFIDDITYDKDGKLYIKNTIEDASKTIILEKQLISMKYDSVKNAIVYKNGLGEEIDVKIPIGKLIKSTSCNDITNTLTITYDDDSTIDIDLSVLFESLTEATGDHIQSISKNNINEFNNTAVTFDIYLNDFLINYNSQIKVYANEIIPSPTAITAKITDNIVLNGVWKCYKYSNNSSTEVQIGVTLGSKLSKYIYVAEFTAPAGKRFNPTLCNKVTTSISDNGKIMYYKIKTICVIKP